MEVHVRHKSIFYAVGGHFLQLQLLHPPSSSRPFGPALGPASSTALAQLSKPLQVAWLARRACRFSGVCAFTKRSRLEQPACLSSTSLLLRPAGVLVGGTRETDQVSVSCPVICSCVRYLSTVAETHRCPRQKGNRKWAIPHFERIVHRAQLGRPGLSGRCLADWDLLRQPYCLTIGRVISPLADRLRFFDRWTAVIARWKSIFVWALKPRSSPCSGLIMQIGHSLPSWGLTSHGKTAGTQAPSYIGFC